MIYFFDEYALDCDRRELRCGSRLVAVEPQVFDLLVHLVRHRGRVVGKDDLIAEVWNRRVISDSTISSRITAARHAVGDSGDRQRLIRTMARKGFRFVGAVREQSATNGEVLTTDAPLPAPGEAGSPQARRPDAPQRRQLTILACGIAGAETLSARVDPEDLNRIVDDCHLRIRDVVERHGGHVATCASDGVTAWFGYPRAYEDDAERAVRAGLAMIRTTGEAEGAIVAEPLQVRVGIATGLVLVGGPGSEASTDAAASGEAPYAARRLLDLVGPGTVAITPTTRRLVGNLFEYAEPARAPVNGSVPLLAPTLVLRESGIASRFEALRPPRKRLIGRAEELDLLLRRWQQVKSGDGRVVLICGEPGIGKSHLVAALQDAIETERPTCARYFCSPHRVQVALHPVITQLERAAAFAEGDADAAKFEKLERLLALSSRAPDRDVALFAELLSITTRGRNPPLALSFQRRKELLLESLAAQLAGLAARGPVLILLEDAHWLDHTTRELFDMVAERIRELPVLLLVTYRPEFDPPWIGQSHVTALTLNRLGRSDNAALVRQVAGGRDLPPRLMDEIAARTDGVPLFIEEVTQSVLESGALRAQGDAWVLDAELPVVTVPTSLQASLVARLDRIAAAREIVQMSAALGREFQHAVLQAVTGLPETELEALLTQLVASGLVHQRGSVPHAVYVFKHALVQDAAYETIPKARRPAIHRRIAEVMEGRFAEVADAHPDVLAYHCTEAGLAEKAIDYWIRSARIALTRSAGVEAQEQVEKAMRLLSEIAPGRARKQLEGRLQIALGDTLVMTKGFASPQVVAVLSKARELMDESMHPLEALRVLCGLFNYHLIRSESPMCLQLAQSRQRQHMNRAMETVHHYLVGTAHLHLGNFAQSIRNLEQALALYDEEACRPVSFVVGYHLRSFILIWLGLGRLYFGSLKLAAETVAAAVSDARSRAHPFTLVSALLAAARFCNHTGDLEGAVAATEEGMAIAVEHRSPYHVSRAGVLRAVNVVEAGEAEKGIALMEEALAAHRATGANFQSSYNLSRLAEAHAGAGRMKQAQELAREAIAEVHRSGERWWEAEAQRILGEILLSSSRGRSEAEACFTTSLECARSQGAKLWELNAALSLGRLWSSQGARERARRLLSPIERAFTDGYAIAPLQSARELLSKSRRRRS